MNLAAAGRCGVGELEGTFADPDPAREGVGGGQVERARAVEDEAPGAGVGARCRPSPSGRR